MRFLIHIILISSILFQSAGKLIVVIHYSINKDYISKNLCENKTKPKLKCNGKCHLKKLLQKEERKEKTPTNNLKEKLEIQFFSIHKTNFNFPIVIEKSEFNSNYLFVKYNKHLQLIDHPPEA